MRRRHAVPDEARSSRPAAPVGRPDAARPVRGRIGSGSTGSVDLADVPDRSSPRRSRPARPGPSRSRRPRATSRSRSTASSARSRPATSSRSPSAAIYDNVVFHRLVPGFVIQGGDGQYGRVPNVDPARVGQGGPGLHDPGRDGDRRLRPRRGGDGPNARSPNSQGSQFFICLDDLSQSLPKSGGYVILGRSPPAWTWSTRSPPSRTAARPTTRPSTRSR